MKKTKDSRLSLFKASQNIYQRQRQLIRWIRDFHERMKFFSHRLLESNLKVCITFLMVYLNAYAVMNSSNCLQSRLMLRLVRSWASWASSRRMIPALMTWNKLLWAKTQQMKLQSCSEAASRCRWQRIMLLRLKRNLLPKSMTLFTQALHTTITLSSCKTSSITTRAMPLFREQVALFLVTLGKRYRTKFMSKKRKSQTSSSFSVIRIL